MVKILEDKELLLKDLCARLPYGVILDVDTTDWRAPQGHIKVKIEGVGILFKDKSLIVNGSYYGDKYKPYLRPMSNITAEEKKEFDILINKVEERCINAYGKGGYTLAFTELNDWLNKKMFDYRGLIEKGLALEAPEGMYNINKE